VNIFFLTETESGCYKWRGAIPAKYLRRRGHRVQILDDGFQAYEAPDVMVIFRAHYPTADKIVEWCKQRSIRVVFDTDDALDRVPRENVHYRELQGLLDLYHFLLENADVVTTTTPVLAADLRQRSSDLQAERARSAREHRADRLAAFAFGPRLRLDSPTVGGVFEIADDGEAQSRESRRNPIEHGKKFSRRLSELGVRSGDRRRIFAGLGSSRGRASRVAPRRARA